MLADSVGQALLVVLDTLEPAERLAFVLHDLFAMPFDAISPLIVRSPAATHQIASRARRRVSAAGRMPAGDLHRQRGVIDAYLHASRTGELDALVALLDPDVVLHADGAPIPTGVPVSLRGAQSGARGAFAATGRMRLSDPALVNGTVGLVLAPLGRLTVALAFTIAGERITATEVIGEPERLRRLDLAVLDVGVA